MVLHVISTQKKNDSALRILSGCFVGTAFEWYDFFIYASAASLVFSKLYFGSGSELTTQLAAFSTFAVGFFARPLGGVVIAHYGDRFGRKNTLVFCLLTMGLATATIGLIPTYESIGIWAPVLLVFLRLVQGVGVGGEWGGAALMAVEKAPQHLRGFYGGFVQIGVPAGLIMANAAFLGVTYFLSDDEFMQWGWRIPFLASILLVVVGILVRLGLEESDLFKKNLKSIDKEKAPIIEALSNHRARIIWSALVYSSTAMMGYVLVAYLLSYGVSVLELDKSVMLSLVLIGSFSWLVSSLLFSYISDRIGRKKLYFIGGVAAIIWAVPFVFLLNTKSYPLMAMATIVFSLPVAATYSPLAALFAELFPTRVRYTASSIGYQLGTIVGGAFVPVIATALQAVTGNSYSLSGYIIVSVMIGLFSLRFIPETAHGSIDY